MEKISIETETFQQDVLNVIVKHCELLGEDIVTRHIVLDELGFKHGEIDAGQLQRAVYYLRKKQQVASVRRGQWTSTVTHEARGNKVCKALQRQKNTFYCPIKNECIGNPKLSCYCSLDLIEGKQQLSPHCKFYI